MDNVAPLANKWSLSAIAAIVYYLANRYELLGEASDPRIEPLQSVLVGLIVLISCFIVEWSLRRRGFLPNLVLSPEQPSASAIESMAVLPSSWND